jgi:hypothetical protein
MAYPDSPEPDLERLMKGLCGDTYEVTGGQPVKPVNVYPQGQPCWLLRKEMIQEGPNQDSETLWLLCLQEGTGTEGFLAAKPMDHPSQIDC